MTKRKSTKKALAASLLSTLLCCAMLIGSTFAWFTDSVSSGRNKIMAGNLDIELEYATASDAVGGIDETEWKDVQTVTNLFNDAALWEPGHTEYVYLRIRNAGTLALKYSLTARVSADEDGTPEKSYTAMATDAEGNHTQFKLSEHLVFNVIDSVAPVADRSELWIKEPTAEADAMGKLTAIDKSEEVLYPAKSGQKSATAFTLAVYMPTTVGNEANWIGEENAPAGETAPQICLGLNLKAMQTPYEEDSFNDQYDKDAGYVYEAVGPTELGPIAKNAKAGDVIQLTGEKFDAAAINAVPAGVALQGEVDTDGNPTTVVEVGGTSVNLKNNSVSNVIFEKVEGKAVDLLDIGDSSGETSFSVENCIFDYSSKPGTSYPGLALRGPGTVKGCQFKGKKGICVDRAVGETLIEDCKFDNGNYDFSILCNNYNPDSHITIKDCEFTKSGQMIDISCPKVTMENSTFNGTLFYLRSNSTWITRNNVFAGNDSMAFQFSGNNITFTSENDTFSSTLSKNPIGDYYLFYLTSSRTGINITIDGEAPKDGWVGPGTLANS